MTVNEQSQFARSGEELNDTAGNRDGTAPLECKALMLSVFSSVVEPRAAVYCSAPITSGKRFVDWLVRSGKGLAHFDEAHESDREAYFNEVILPNREHAQVVIRSLRRRTTRQVIDPTSVPAIPGWRQPDWLVFWEEVITVYASELVFIDGWEFSNGCAHEFWFAQARGLPTFDERGRQLTLPDGIAMIRSAAGEIRQQDGPVARLDTIIEALVQLSE